MQKTTGMVYRQARLGRLGFAALLLLGLGFAVPAAAQVTVTENIDEPGRNPYQEGGSATSFQNGYRVSFSTVPAQTRRVILHASCVVYYNPPKYKIFSIFLHNTDYSSGQEYLPPKGSYAEAAGILSVVFASNLHLYVDAGQSPVIDLGLNDPKGGGQCRLDGYDIALPPPADISPPS